MFQSNVVKIVAVDGLATFIAKQMIGFISIKIDKVNSISVIEWSVSVSSLKLICTISIAVISLFHIWGPFHYHGLTKILV